MAKPSDYSRRDFLRRSLLTAGGMAVLGSSMGSIGSAEGAQSFGEDQVVALEGLFKDKPEVDWLQTARTFLLDAYQPPLVPDLQYDAQEWARMMADMGVNIIRFGTMGKYATIQGIRFSPIPEMRGRDLLQETIDACSPHGIDVFPYISTGHKLAWTMVTKDHPEYAQKATPGGPPNRSHMYVGEDMGTICWMGPYREAWFDYVTHVVRDYHVKGMYFDTLVPFYFWTGKKLCYCDACKKGFRAATGLEIPYQEREEDYSAKDLDTIDKYHDWYTGQFSTEVIAKLRGLVKSYKDIPLMCNINNPQWMATMDPHVMNAMDAFLYERGRSLLERAQGIGVPRSMGLSIWPYVGTYHSWPRLAFQGVNYQQQIFANLSFGAGSIIAQPTGYVKDTRNRKYVSHPFGIIKQHERTYKGLQNYPYIGVLFSYKSPKKHIQTGWHTGVTDAHTSTLGAFSACLYNHLQVGSISEFVLDDPERLRKYPILYLANVPVLSKARIHNIVNYVREGGKLITSYATTLFDESGEPQSTFGLEAVMKVRPIKPEEELADIMESYTSMIGGPNDLYMLPAKDAPQGSSLGEGLIPLWYYQPVEVLEGAKTLMNIVTGNDLHKILPGVVLSSFGQGKVLYCASGLESFYNNSKPDVIGALIKQFVHLVADQPAPYTLDAPDGLMANLAQKENTLVLHMTNWTGDKYEKNLMNEYYLSPIHDVSLKIHIPEGKKVKQVSTIIPADYRKKVTGQYLEISFPSIEAYQAVVVNLG